MNSNIPLKHTSEAVSEEKQPTASEEGNSEILRQPILKQRILKGNLILN